MTTALETTIPVERDVRTYKAAVVHDFSEPLVVEDVPRRELGQVGHQLGLGERRLEVELTPEPDRLRDLVEELLDRSDADGGEHRVAVGVGERGERHRDSTSSR